jgi:hypothetical protein
MSPVGPGFGLGMVPDRKNLYSPAALYILMPETLLAHNNTIGTTGFSASSSHRYGFVNFPLTVLGGTHISPAPDDERGRRNRLRD